MVKLILLLFIIILGDFLMNINVSASQFLDDIHELDQIYKTASMDKNNPDQLPSTPRALYESWCRPYMKRITRIMELVDKLFEDNPIFLILFKVIEMSKLNMMGKLCERRHSILVIADYYKAMNRYLYRYIPWYKTSVNTYLSAADPDSPVDAGHLVCLMKKLVGLLAAVKIPPRVKKGGIDSLSDFNQPNFKLAKNILDYFNVDFKVKDCHLAKRRYPNPLGIKSIDVAFLLAWDRVTRQFL